jgi:eukaryotic-like serine/threonine-protein kinase
VEVTIDGEYVGRSPVFVWPLDAGRHVLRLKSQQRMVNTTKVVMLEDAGITRQEIYLSKGYITVNAPDGAQVTVDGKVIGVAPLKEVGVYEGEHRVVVTIHGSRWEDVFNIAPHQRLTFTVDFE